MRFQFFSKATFFQTPDFNEGTEYGEDVLKQHYCCFSRVFIWETDVIILSRGGCLLFTRHYLIVKCC